ncbi:hypothetical protein WJX73_005010 [Symbiochloris irregularis]|uniref:Protein kinase domain-containing protein n=1 Tax=Symbiochloris irregularis TaxID=706552 RepID=A0AAW1NNE8_9CHLO
MPQPPVLSTANTSLENTTAFNEYFTAKYTEYQSQPGFNATVSQPCAADYTTINAPPSTCTGSWSSSVTYNNNTGCLTEQNANYNGTSVLVPFNFNIVNTSQECCNLCQSAQSGTYDLQFPCNSWIWCGNPSGCCGLGGKGCSQQPPFNHFFPFGMCTLKYMYEVNPTEANQSYAVDAWYQASDVTNWNRWTVNGTSYTQECKAFTSGLTVYNPSIVTQLDPGPQSGFEPALIGQQIPGHDYVCANSTDPNTPQSTCRDYGPLQVLSDRCQQDSMCDALVLEPLGCCNQSNSTAFRKNFGGDPNVGQQCLLAQPFASTWLFNGTHPASSTLTTQSQTGSSSSTGAIVGGVVGGVVGAVLLAALAAVVVCNRRRRGSVLAFRTPPTKRRTLEDSSPETQEVWLSGQRRRGGSDSGQYSGSYYSNGPNSNSQYTGSTELPAWLRRERGSYGEGSAPDDSGDPDASCLQSGGTRTASAPHSRSTPPPSGEAASIKSVGSSNAGTRLLASMRSGTVQGTPGVIPKEWDIHPNDIRIAKLPGGKDHQLGAGGFGKVYKGYLHDVDPVAIKALKGEQDKRLQAAFLKEIDILRRSRHPHIVQYLGAVTAGGHTLLVCEYMEGGDLWTALSRDDGAYSWKNRGRHVALEVSLALHYLHSHNTIHFDLKSANVLLTRTGTAKVADVGLARIMRTTQYTRAEVPGTWAWAAPETILNLQCTPKVDVFSFGVLMWEIITGEIPVRGQLRSAKVPEECSEEVAALMDRCLDGRPELRPDMRAIIEALRVLI